MSHITPNHGPATGVPEDMTTFALERRPARVRARTRTVVDVDTAEGRVTTVRTQLNPEKLAGPWTVAPTGRRPPR